MYNFPNSLADAHLLNETEQRQLIVRKDSNLLVEQQEEHQENDEISIVCPCNRMDLPENPMLPVCTPCMTTSSAPSSSKSSKCHCQGNRDQLIDLKLPPSQYVLSSHENHEHLDWEARMDRHGRIFFVDHANKRTSWERPRAEIGREKTEREQRRQMDKRYVALRRTIAKSRPASSNFENPDEGRDFWPAVQFIQRIDFFTLLFTNEKANELYNTSPFIKHIVRRVRKDSSKFDKYQHNSDMVVMLNEFADQSQLLPSGWEMRREISGKALFIDHARRRTTFIDPRLPMAIWTDNNSKKRRRTHSTLPSDIRLQTADKYALRVVQLLKRPEFQSMLAERMPNMVRDPKMRKKLNHIAKVGPFALQRYGNDIDIITMLSLFEMETSASDIYDENEEKNKKERDEFEQKLSNFYQVLRSRGYGQGPNELKLNLRRKNLLTDAYEQILVVDKQDLQKSRIIIAFDDEDGLDYGGPSREFFFFLSRELFNPYYGLFEYSANDIYTVQMSPMSMFVDNYVKWFHFCGRVLGLALIHRFLIDTFFTRAFYKFILKLSCSISDLESLDSQFHNSLQWLQDNNIDDKDLQLTFSINEEVGGKVVEKELKKGGDKIPVTDSNKAEYIRRLVSWRLDRGVRKQGQSLLKGFYEVVDPGLISMFDARELELVLSGSVEIDIYDWRRNTDYRGGYEDNQTVIRWFWQAVERFNNGQRLQLLQFVTGTSSIPYEGFSALRGSQGPKKFTIERWGSPNSLPRAHTCFNRLDLPAYISFSNLHKKLLLAISETDCYAIE